SALTSTNTQTPIHHQTGNPRPPLRFQLRGDLRNAARCEVGSVDRLPPGGVSVTCGFACGPGLWFAVGVLHVDAAGINVCGVNALLLPCYSCFWLLCCGRDNGLFSAVAFPLIATSADDLHVTDDIFPTFRVWNDVICFRARWCSWRVEV